MPQSQRRGPWVPEEDQALLRLVNSQGPNNWVRISQHMKYRTPKQCRERFHQNLKPTLNHDPITAEEGLMIERMVDEMGKRWAEIARRLGNRSDNAVKNWWNGSVNRKRRGLVISCASSTTAGGASRTFHGRIEPPYTRNSSSSPVHLTSSFRDHDSRSPRPLDFYSQGRDYSASTTNLPRYDYGSSTASHRNWAHQRPQSNSPIITSRGRQLTPLFTHSNSSAMQMDSSMTSPSFSEISNPASIGRPPSMISDHNSIASSSPRTVNSPAGLAVPMEIQQHSYEERRRGSAPLVIPSIFNNNNSSKTNNGQLHSIFDSHTPNHKHTYSGQHPGPDMLDQPHPSAFQPHIKHQYSSSAPHNQLPPIRTQTQTQPPQSQSRPTPTTNTTRDSRMGLATLLN